MIKLLRYKNRKLYNKDIGGYVTSEHVYGYLKQGSIISVTNYVTGSDVTKESLTELGASQMRQGNIQAANLLLAYAMAYRTTSSVVEGA